MQAFIHWARPCQPLAESGVLHARAGTSDPFHSILVLLEQEQVTLAPRESGTRGPAKSACRGPWSPRAGSRRQQGLAKLRFFSFCREGPSHRDPSTHGARGNSEINSHPFHRFPHKPQSKHTHLHTHPEGISHNGSTQHCATPTGPLTVLAAV